jgi:ABC-type multidrug transport system fused ATPase/permease subunit
MSFTHDFWRPPLAAIGAGFFIFQQVGYAGLLGMAILILFMPLQGKNLIIKCKQILISNAIAWLGKRSANVRMETAQRTDERVKSMFSIITGIQVIKMYGWENAFAKSINAIRKFELKAIARGYYIRATLLSLVFLPTLAVFATFVTYVSMGNTITAVKAFVTIAYFNYVRASLVEFWPMAVTSVAEGWVSMQRVEEFLAQKVNQKVEPVRRKSVRIQSLEKGIFMRNATAYWNQDGDNNNVGVIGIDVDITKMNLIALIGHVGCGKTTLLEVILKELPLIDGDMSVNGTISYAAQQTWVFEGSIKRNIIFTEDYDEERYKKVLHVCALESDLELMPHGDKTIVGDRGISLSGGQRARVNLARAVYKNADIYLLDDPLSAVDAHVGKHIFEKCIKEFLHVSNESIIIIMKKELRKLLIS